MIRSGACYKCVNCWKHVWLRLNGDWGLGVGDGHVIGATNHRAITIPNP